MSNGTSAKVCSELRVNLVDVRPDQTFSEVQNGDFVIRKNKNREHFMKKYSRSKFKDIQRLFDPLERVVHTGEGGNVCESVAQHVWSSPQVPKRMKGRKPER